MHTLHIVYSFIHQWTFGLDILASVDNAAVTMSEHISEFSPSVLLGVSLEVEILACVLI